MLMEIVVYNTSSGAVTSKDIPKKFLLNKINQHLIWEVITAENANLRQGTHQAKTRGEVRGGGGKPWRQKGTGRARAGSNRSPVWVGGGVAFGPRPRNYRQNVGKKKKNIAYLNIIAKKIKDGKVMLLDQLKLDKISTSTVFCEITKALEKAPFHQINSQGVNLRKKTNDGRRNITIVVNQDDQWLKKSVKNIPWISLIHAQRLAARPVLYNHGLLLTESAFDTLTETL